MIGRAVEKTLRLRYQARWRKRWPHDRATLNTLWLESKAEHGLSPECKKHPRLPEVYETCLTLMRLDHHF